MIVIIESPISNINSVKNAFTRIGEESCVSGDLNIIEKAKGLVLPGVGAFGEGVKYLNKTGIAELIKYRVSKQKTPLLGICLGHQLLANFSEEQGQHNGLELIRGKVIKIQSKEERIRVPNIGWHYTNIKKPSPLFPKKVKIEAFYFVHSFHFVCEDSMDVLAEIQYGGQSIVAAVSKDNVFGVQFHPEKSQDAGLNMLKAFSKVVKEYENGSR